LFLPQAPANCSNYEGWSRKFVELWVSHFLGSLIDWPIHGTVQHKLKNNGGQVATPELQTILAEAQRGLAHVDEDSWLE
jgi:hypothetical protein